MRNGRYAAIDIGTVTCRMLVADVRDEKIFELAKEYRITNLGEGVDATHKLSQAAMERVGAALDDFLVVRETLNTPRDPLTGTMVCATSAARDAENASEFKAMLAQHNLELQIISGNQEAALTFNGATSRYSGENVMVVDVGGGSTELSLGIARKEIQRTHSFNIGSRRMTERFFKCDPPANSELAEARLWVHDQFCEWLNSGENPRIDRMIAVAGTATSVVSIREKMRVYDSGKVDGAQVPIEELQAIEQNLASLTLEQREKVTGLDPGRAPVIIAGLLILEEAMLVANMPNFTASESDILQGMILHMAA